MDQNQNTNTGNTLRQEAGADRERLLSHLREAVSDAEQWLNGAAKDGPADIEQAKKQFQEAIGSAKTDLLKLEDSLLARGKLACKSADAYVHDSPWVGVGIAAAAGLALGYFIGRE